MTKVNEKSENATIINGVVLTDRACKQLTVLQEGDNHLIKHCRESIADAICHMTTDISNVEELKQVGPIIQELSFIRGLLEDLRKP